MVKLKFIVRDGFLVLRISEGKERYYKSVKSILVGNPNILKHWKADKERFSTYATSYQENRVSGFFRLVTPYVRNKVLPACT